MMGNCLDDILEGSRSVLFYLLWKNNCRFARMGYLYLLVQKGRCIKRLIGCVAIFEINAARIRMLLAFSIS